MTQPAARLGYLPQLDGLRAVAIGLVVGYHLGVPLTWGGYLGVDVFLVLSGFLITSILLRERAGRGTIRLGRFWIRRLLRLYPAVIAMVLAALVLSSWVHHDGEEPIWLAGIFALTYTSNLAVAIGGLQLGGLEHTWSLALEEQFYLVWPLALLLIFRLRARTNVVVPVLLALAAASYVLGWALFEVRGDQLTPTSYYRPDARAGTLLLGCALAFVFNTDRGKAAMARVSLPAAAAGLVLLAGLVITMPHEWPSTEYVFGGYFPLAGLASVLLVGGLAAGSHWLVGIFASPLFVWFGLISYSLYLWHLPAFRLASELGEGPAVKGVQLLLAIGLAVASYYVVERPFLRLKDRFEPAARAERAADRAITR